MRKLDYHKFLETKISRVEDSGFDIDREQLNPKLFDYQKDIVKWSLKKGKSAIWADCGLGKTAMQLEYGHQVHKRTGGDVLIIAPLAVVNQTVREGNKFGYKVNICRKQEDVKEGLNITNYEMIEHFKVDQFIAVVLDESSILKSFTGKYRTLLIDMFKNTQYKLSCTATPAPNDYMELGNHAEFTGVMTRTEMLSTFFVHDSGDTSKWRLKGHAEGEFWKWISNWAVVLQKPSDLGYSDEGFTLPKLNIEEIIVPSKNDINSFLPKIAQTLQERRQARKESLEDRVNESAKLANENKEQWTVWCDLNAESEALKKAIGGAVEVRGSDKGQHKIDAALGFVDGDIRVIVSKPSIFGWGLNWQHCNNMIFTGLSDSYEQFYQAVRRCWRFGQKKDVNVYIVISEAEGSVKENIDRKSQDADKMMSEIVKHTHEILTKEVHGTTKETINYNPTEKMVIPKWLKGVV